MLKFYKSAVIVLGFTTAFTHAQSENQIAAPETENSVEIVDQKKDAPSGEQLQTQPFPTNAPKHSNELGIEEVSAPAYTALEFVHGWSRASADSARSIKEWGRWWKYLRLKQPVMMNWINGLKLRIYPKNEIFRAIFVRGIYDPNLIVAVNSFLHKGSTFIDVGSNMGYFSLLASSVVGEDGTILAIEPSSRDYNRLVDNVNINQLHNISPYRLAISDKNGQAKISIACEERSALNTLGTSFGFKGVEKISVEDVETATIDDLVQKEKITSIDVLKVDVEGSELVALRGARNSIEKFRPVIMLGANEGALNACGVDIGELKTLLKDLRYKAYVLVESPRFEFVPCDNLENPNVKIVFCMHDSIVPPSLPQPQQRTLLDAIRDFFTK